MWFFLSKQSLVVGCSHNTKISEARLSESKFSRLCSDFPRALRIRSLPVDWSNLIGRGQSRLCPDWLGFWYIVILGLRVDQSAFHVRPPRNWNQNYLQLKGGVKPAIFYNFQFWKVKLYLWPPLPNKNCSMESRTFVLMIPIISFFSSSGYPSSLFDIWLLMIFICFTMVDFPLSSVVDRIIN